MNDKFLCVLAGYDEASEERLTGFQNELYRAGFVGTQTKDVPMHVTMGTFPVEDEERVTGLVRTIAADTEPFLISVSHVGLFAGSKVLFAAPDCSRELLALREHFGASPGWVPHTTMLIDEPETVQRALPVLMEQFTPLAGKVTSLHLCEFFPTRHILTVRLGSSQLADTEEK